MQIKTILQSKPHNQHWLNRYLKFLEFCEISNNGVVHAYTENHHILPKCMFKEYENLKTHQWNSIKLSHRQHIIAHYMLMKAYPHNDLLSLSVLWTYNQPHAKKIKYTNSRIIESAKISLSMQRKGVFTRGYDENGNANVSDETRKKLSRLKKELYSNEENRKYHSICCTGIKRSEQGKANIKLGAKNRKPQPKESYIKGVATRKSKNYKMQSGSLGIYVTPIGYFDSFYETPYNRYCTTPDKIISIHNIKKNPMLNKNVIGMTFRELGFYIIPKSDTLTVKELYDLIDIIHPPEPNHPLSSELNDYLLHRNSQN